MSLAEIKDSIAEMTPEERGEVANLIAQLNHTESPEHQPRPEGYFASDYPLPEDRRALEEAMAKTEQRPER